QPAPEPAPQQAETRPAAPQTKEGDLVPQGAEGLNPPQMVRRGAVTYPQIARMQRAQGTVITSVLVSETGSVLQVKIIRGVSGPGLNEAAMEAMRKSSFSPGTKDGVKVKSWVTV